MTRGCGLHLIGVWMRHRLIPTLHWGRQWWRLHGRGQCITAVASSIVVGATCGTQPSLILTDRVSLRGIMDMYVTPCHVATTSASCGKVRWQRRRMLASGCDLIAILCSANSTEWIAIQILLGTTNGTLRRDAPGREAAR